MWEQAGGSQRVIERGLIRVIEGGLIESKRAMISKSGSNHPPRTYFLIMEIQSVSGAMQRSRNMSSSETSYSRS